MSEKKISDMEMILSKFLRGAILTCGSIILIGLLLFFLSGKSGYPGTTYPTTPTEIFKGLLLCKPYAIILSGLLLLISTPVFRVGISILVFLKEGDLLYVKITTIVFIILLLSFAMGNVG